MIVSILFLMTIYFRKGKNQTSLIIFLGNIRNISFYGLLDFFYPLGCLFYLLKHKSKLDSSELRAKFGFYINGYKNKLYFLYIFLF